MWTIIRKYSGLLFVWGIVLAAVAVGLSLLLPLQYSAIGQVLIISRDRTGVDPYTQAKSAERIGDSLAEVMQTSDFYNKVIDESDPVQFDRAHWTKMDDRTRRKSWQQDVNTEIV